MSPDSHHLNPPPTDVIRRFYDRLGPRYDWAAFYEGRAKARALELLDLNAGLRLVNVGLGTGQDHRAMQAAVGAGGLAVGMDISQVMVRLSRKRTGAPVCQADARLLPFADATFDRLHAAYVLDILPQADLPDVLAGFMRALKPGGRMVLVTMTEGVDLPSRAFVALWKRLYGISPLACGGCRPLQLTNLARSVGLQAVTREVVVQFGVPSEILVAERGSSALEADAVGRTPSLRAPEQPC